MNSDLLFDMIESIAKVSSIKQKQNMMIPELEQVFRYAYDPFKNYGIKNIEFKTTNIKSRDNKYTYFVDRDMPWSLLDSLAAKRITGNAARRYAHSYASLLSLKSRKLFHRILIKDLRCGVSVKHINKVYGDIIADGITMQPKEYDNITSRMIQWPWYASFKLRGIRGYYRWRDNQIYSRKGKPLYGLQHLIMYLNRFCRDFDGELLVPGVPLEESVSAIRNKQITPEVHFCLYDVPSDKINSFRIRWESLKNLQRFFVNTNIIITNHTLVDKQQAEQMFKRSIKSGYEGVVLKNPKSKYVTGKTSQWLKMKELQKPLFLKVKGVYEGKGKYHGKLGGVIVEYSGGPVNVGGGFTDSDRLHFWSYPEKIVGRYIRVKYQEVTKDNQSLRNPIYLGVLADGEVKCT